MVSKQQYCAVLRLTHGKLVQRFLNILFAQVSFDARKLEGGRQRLGGDDVLRRLRGPRVDVLAGGTLGTHR